MCTHADFGITTVRIRFQTTKSNVGGLPQSNTFTTFRVIEPTKNNSNIKDKALITLVDKGNCQPIMVVILSHGKCSMLWYFSTCASVFFFLLFNLGN